MKRVGRAALPEAHLLPGKDLLKNELDGELVRIRGVLRQHVVGADEDVLLIEAGPTALSALLEHPGGPGPRLDLGSVVEVAGVAAVQATRVGESHRAERPPPVRRRPVGHQGDRGRAVVHGRPRGVDGGRPRRPRRRVAGVDRDAAPPRPDPDGGAARSQDGGRERQPRQERVRGQHEPRDPHADERRAGDDRAAARRAAAARAPPVPRDRQDVGRRAARTSSTTSSTSRRSRPASWS